LSEFKHSEFISQTNLNFDRRKSSQKRGSGEYGKELGINDLEWMFKRRVSARNLWFSLRKSLGNLKEYEEADWDHKYE
jgi:hypothetical protein